MSAAAWLAILIPCAYLAGSIPFGLLVGLSKGIDPRKAGSGNIGATNVGRLLGAKFFGIVFLLDMLKGLIPTFIAGRVLTDVPAGATTYWMWLSVAFAAIIGHMFSVFLGFKGGKGVATSLGVVLGVWPFYTLAGVVAGLAWAVLFWRTRIVSVASIVAAVLFPIAYVGIGIARGWPITGEQWPLLVFACFVAAMITYKHRSNIKRLLAGTESSFAKKAPDTSASSPQQK